MKNTHFPPTQQKEITSNSKKPHYKKHKSMFFPNPSLLLKFGLTAGDVIFVFEINNRVYPSMAC